MILNPRGREYYALQITTTPATTATDWSASFDGGSTWSVAVNVSGYSAWLVAGSLAALGTAVATVSSSVTPLVRLTANPEIVVRDAPKIQIT